MNLIQRFKALPNPSRRLLSVGIIFALVVALPLFIWSISHLNFNPFKKAATGEPGVCLPINNIITVTPASDVNGTCHDIQTAVNNVTGSGFTIQIAPGSYNVSGTISVTGKSNLTINGDQSGNSQIGFNTNGWGFNIASSSGSIQYLTAQGVTPNGLLSINQSSNFNILHTNLYATSSHTLDVYNSNNISIENSEIQSSAGAVTIGGSSNISISNNKIHNSDNAISVNTSSYVTIQSNLVYGNRESGLILINNSPTQTLRNTFVNNGNGINTPTISLGTPSGANNQFLLNIVSGNTAPGISATGGQTFSLFSQNDIFGNSPNYLNYPDQTGLASNISADPLLNSTNNIFCPAPNSPVIFGNVGNGDYMGYIGPCGPTPVPTPTPTPMPTSTPSGSPSPTPTATPSGSPTPPPTVRPFSILLKLNGVDGNNAEGANVSARFESPILPSSLGYITPPLPITYVGSGVYKLMFGVWSTNLPPANNYSIILKGEKHLGTKFCQPTGQTTHCSTQGQISIPANPLTLINLDFTGMPLMPGDLYPQDGVADANDFNAIVNLLSKPCSALTAQDKLVGDLDYSGCVTVRDIYLMRLTLQTRYDDN